MKQEELSVGSAIFGQALIVLFAIVFETLCIYIILKDCTVVGGAVLCFITLVIVVIVRNAFSYGDVYLTDEGILIKKITGSVTKSKTEIELVSEGLMPFTFYMKFHDGKKIYFQFKPKNIVRNFFVGDSNDILNELKSKLNS